jgi:hypothetical protein
MPAAAAITELTVTAVTVVRTPVAEQVAVQKTQVTVTVIQVETPTVVKVAQES